MVSNSPGFVFFLPVHFVKLKGKMTKMIWKLGPIIFLFPPSPTSREIARAEGVASEMLEKAMAALQPSSASFQDLGEVWQFARFSSGLSPAPPSVARGRGVEGRRNTR